MVGSDFGGALAVFSVVLFAAGTAADGQEVSEMPVDRVMSGIVFLDELRTSIGTLLVPKVFEVTDAFLERMRNFGPGILQERVRVMAAPKRVKLAAPTSLLSLAVNSASASGDGGSGAVIAL